MKKLFWIAFCVGFIVASTFYISAEPASTDGPAIKRKFDVLGMIWHDVQSQEPGSDRRKELLAEFLGKSQEYLALLPEGDKSAGQVWTFRALAACELGREDDAKTAGFHMQELGLDKSESSLATKALAYLDRKGWLVDPKVERQKIEVEAKRHLVQQKTEADWRALVKQWDGNGGGFVISNLDLTLIPVAPGTFFMGAGDGDAAPDKIDGIQGKPRMAVRLTQGYWLGKTEVTEAQWDALMGTSFVDRILKKYPTVKVNRRDVEKNYYGNASGDPLLAVSEVSWHDAMEFCSKLTDQEAAAHRIPAGYAYTLPTEAQWEMACRAGTETTYHFGDSLEHSSDYCAPVMFTWVNKSHNAFLVNQVQTKKANPWGFYDMEGNVWEWCLDAFADSYPNYSISAEGYVENPVNAQVSQGRALRGGAIGGPARMGCAQSSARLSVDLGYDVGFRVALAPIGAQGNQ